MGFEPTCSLLIFRFVNSFVYYGLTFAASDLVGGPYVNLFLSGLVEFVGFLPAIFMLDRIGRRLPLASMLIFAGLACVIIAVIPEGKWKHMAEWIGQQT